MPTVWASVNLSLKGTFDTGETNIVEAWSSYGFANHILAAYACKLLLDFSHEALKKNFD